MKKLLSENPLLRGSAVVMAGSLIASFLNYLFQFLAGRLLSPADYGTLTSLFSILYIVGIPGGVLGTTATKFASTYKARNDFKAVTATLVWVEKAVAALGLALFLLAFFGRNQLAEFLKIDNPSLPAVFFIFIALSFLGSAPTGFLQGLSRFKAYSFISVWSSLLKVLLGAGLAFLGFGIWGVVWGLIAMNLLSIVTCLALLKKNLRARFEESLFSPTDLLHYALPAAVVLLSLVSLYNMDVILVKHFFSPEEAGVYSSVVMLGRIIFFGLGSVQLVMFPLASEKFENGGNPFSIFKKSLLLVGVGAVAGASVYFLFPQILVKIFFGEQYLSAAPYLGMFAVFMGLYAVADLFSRFSLSIRSFRPAVILAVFALLQTVLIYFFHGALSQVIFVNIGVMGGVLSAFGVLYACSSG